VDSARGGGKGREGFRLARLKRKSALVDQPGRNYKFLKGTCRFRGKPCTGVYKELRFTSRMEPVSCIDKDVLLSPQKGGESAPAGRKKRKKRSMNQREKEDSLFSPRGGKKSHYWKGYKRNREVTLMQVCITFPVGSAMNLNLDRSQRKMERERR